MTFTAQDLAAVEAAIASGELVISANGRTVTYRSMADLLQARSTISRALAAQSAAAATGPRHLLANFAD